MGNTILGSLDLFWILLFCKYFVPVFFRILLKFLLQMQYSAGRKLPSAGDELCSKFCRQNLFRSFTNVSSRMQSSFVASCLLFSLKFCSACGSFGLSLSPSRTLNQCWKNWISFTKLPKKLLGWPIFPPILRGGNHWFSGYTFKTFA